MTRLVHLCLNEKLEEPLLEWMIISRIKLYDPVHESRFTYDSSQEDFYRFLREKLELPEMKQKRQNVQRYGYYY